MKKINDTQPNENNEDRKKQMHETLSLVPTFKKDMQITMELESKYNRYQNIKAQTLLLGGDKSPAFLHNALIILEKTIPNSKRIELPGLRHNAPDDAAPELIANILKKFFELKKNCEGR